jgi:hypothetical protein
MLHQSIKTNEKSLSMKQVEINTMACGGGHNGMKIGSLHREILKWVERTDIIEKVKNATFFKTNQIIG